MRNVIVLVLAVLGAGITMYMVYTVVNRPPDQSTPVVQQRNIEIPPTIPTSKVLVAKKDLAVGAFIREGDLHWQDWPDQSISPSYVVEQKKILTETGKTEKKLTIKDFLGSVARQPIAAGQPLSIGMVGRPGERGFLAAVLRPGMRAFSVSTSPINSVSGFILPGDRVDILWKATNSGGQPFVQTLMSDVRVIAVNTATQATDITPASSFTFELTPKKVHALHLASSLGSFNFVLRSIAPDRELQEGVAADGIVLADASDIMTADQLFSGAALDAKSVFDEPPVEKDFFTLPDEIYYDRGAKRPTPKRTKKTTKSTTRTTSKPATSKTVQVTVIRGASGSTVKVRNEP